jgi:hypothetical protein
MLQVGATEEEEEEEEEEGQPNGTWYSYIRELE